MTTSTLYRLSGFALIASFAFSLVGGVLHPVIDGQSHSAEVFLADGSPWAQYSIYVGAVFLMLGLPGAYLFFRDQLGVLGFVGFTTYMIGNALSAMSHLVVEAFVGPALAKDPAASHMISTKGEIFDADSFIILQAAGGLVFVIGLTIIAIALIRAKGIPTWIGGFLLAGVVPLFIPVPERQGIAGLIVELPRGLMVAALAVIMIRSLASADKVTDKELQVA